MDYRLKTIGIYTSSEEIIYPYDLQSSKDLLIHRSKLSCEILTLSNYQNVTPKRLKISSNRTPRPTEYPQLNINKSRVFDNSNLKEKNYLMLHPYLLPDCVLKNVHYLKCEISPFGERTGYVLACLTTSGIIELYSYNVDCCELQRIDVNMSELRKNSNKKLTKEITKFDVLLASYNEIAFANFEWCGAPLNDYKVLIGVTKNDDLIFYHIQDNTVVEMKSMKVENLSKNRLKWMNLNGRHFLLTTTQKGDLIRYSVEFGDEETISNVQKVDVIAGKLKMPVSFIAVDHHESSAVILCCKGHTLEIFDMRENSCDMVFSKYIGMSITGITDCGDFEYLVTSLNSKVFCLKLSKSDDRLSLDSCSRLTLSSTEDLEVMTNYHGFYGIGISKNHVMIYISCYPQNPFDHLVNKQPSHISLNLFTKYDPLKILVNNSSLKLTDYLDCTEVVKYLGLEKFEMLQVLEQMDYDISISQKFLYYLKIQLLVINVKLIYYQMKSRNIFYIIKETMELIKELILVINSQIRLKAIIKSEVMTDEQYSIVRCLKNSIFKYCNTSVDKEPFRTAIKTLKPELKTTLDVCDAMEKLKALPLEICTFCGDTIAEDRLECKSNHNLKRCVVTNMLIPLDCNNYCRNCKESVSKLEILSTMLNDLGTDILLCPFCDLKFFMNG